MRHTKEIAISLVFVAILNLQPGGFSIRQNPAPAMPKMQPSTTVLTAIDPAGRNADRFNITLWIKDWTERIAFANLNVTVYDLERELVSSYLSSETGRVDLDFLHAGSYAVTVQDENRTVGYQMIHVAESEEFVVKCWAYDFIVKCVDRENNPLPEHIVFLYDQLVFHTPTNFTVAADQTGLLVNWTKTDENGVAYFKDVWNGTYTVKIAAGKPIGEETVNLQRPESIILKCNKTFLSLAVATGSGEPLSNATVYVYNSAGDLVFRDHTDETGYVSRESIYVDKYNVFVEWMGMEVWSGIVDVRQDREQTVSCSVFRLTVHVTDPFGNPLPHAEADLRKRIMRAGHREYIDLGFRLKTDERGQASCFLPSGVYEVTSSYGVYSGSTAVDLIDDRTETVNCSVELKVWSLALFVASPLVGITLLLERKRLRKPLEIRKYKNMLSKLESMYRGGLVEYKLYRKLREEYEAKLMELGGREMR